MKISSSESKTHLMIVNANILFDDYVLSEKYLSFETYLIAKKYNQNDIKIIKKLLK